MFVEICLTIITITLIMLVIVLVRISAHSQDSIQRLQKDLNQISTSTAHLAKTFEEFIRSDLHKISGQTSELLGQLSDLTADLNNKSRSLNFLFKPLKFLTAKLFSNSSSPES